MFLVYDFRVLNNTRFIYKKTATKREYTDTAFSETSALPSELCGGALRSDDGVATPTALAIGYASIPELH